MSLMLYHLAQIFAFADRQMKNEARQDSCKTDSCDVVTYAATYTV